VERPALHSAFGNKEALFRKALARYQERYMDFVPGALGLPTTREVAACILGNTAERNTRYADHRGCLNVNGALAVSDESEPSARRWSRCARQANPGSASASRGPRPKATSPRRRAPKYWPRT